MYGVQAPYNSMKLFYVHAVGEEQHGDEHNYLLLEPCHLPECNIVSTCFGGCYLCIQTVFFNGILDNVIRVCFFRVRFVFCVRGIFFLRDTTRECNPRVFSRVCFSFCVHGAFLLCFF